MSHTHLEAQGLEAHGAAATKGSELAVERASLLYPRVCKTPSGPQKHEPNAKCVHAPLLAALRPLHDALQVEHVPAYMFHRFNILRHSRSARLARCEHKPQHGCGTMSNMSACSPTQRGVAGVLVSELVQADGAYVRVLLDFLQNNNRKRWLQCTETRCSHGVVLKPPTAALDSTACTQTAHRTPASSEDHTGTARRDSSMLAFGTSAPPCRDCWPLAQEPSSSCGGVATSLPSLLLTAASSGVRAFVKDCLGVVSSVNTETSAMVVPRQPRLCKQQSTACRSQAVSSNGAWSHTAPVWDTTTNVSNLPQPSRQYMMKTCLNPLTARSTQPGIRGCTA